MCAGALICVNERADVIRCRKQVRCEQFNYHRVLQRRRRCTFDHHHHHHNRNARVLVCLQHGSRPAAVCVNYITTSAAHSL